MKTVLTIGIASTLALASYAQTIYDDFSFGPDIPGRVAVTEGTTINDRFVLEGTGTWKTTGGTNNTHPRFGGTAGTGNGYLDMSNLGSTDTANVNFDFSSGNVSATFNFTMDTNGVGGSNSRGIFFGFSATNPDDSLMTNQKTDTVWVRIRPDGVVLRSQIEGVQTNRIDSAITFSGPDDIASGTVTLTYNLATSTVTATVLGGSYVFEESITFTTSSEYTPDLGKVGMNVITMNNVHIQDISASVIPEPQTLALSFGLFALTVAMLIRTRYQRKKAV
ncbi:hypothetical protein H5P28_06410 [Ruficoccus amylovorans]|uniref:Uncharacterized protein n=1 Tax=Ruficoccus amylovorans TaxID=1804625 RepID=A0A842HCA9_9BACT|nr:hypothetical protein [Ruficoccus amylovorans]MBC2593890.1 hypothetical protein [Ruficoccus amylovorans]